MSLVKRSLSPPSTRFASALFAVAISFAFASGCVVFADPTYKNPCGGTELLTADGEAAVPGAACGVCDNGHLVCDGIDAIKCVGATFSCTQSAEAPRCGEVPPNGCGGCDVLAGVPGSEEGCGDGIWVCRTPDMVECDADAANVCGGSEIIEAAPGLPCGPCDRGVLTCAFNIGDLNALQCVHQQDEDGQDEIGNNECGGCNLLNQPLGETCGCGGSGAYVCTAEGTDGVACVDADPYNGCGGCEELPGLPGRSCGEGSIIVCAGANSIDCRPEDTTNVCGGRGVLTGRPGDSCGDCSDGTYVCASRESLVCVEATERNECGGCGFAFPFEVGTACGPNHTWACGAEQMLICAENLDEDGDGQFDDVDNCDTEENPDQADWDGDGIGDACDDSDGDSFVDAIDDCPEVPNQQGQDANGNGIGDACEDSDFDGVFDGEDNCPIPNPDQADLDGDGEGDACDDDRDGDGTPNAADNCPETPNPDGADIDGDGIGDACDDSDDDGVFDGADNCLTVVNPAQIDTDEDGAGNACDDDDDNDSVPDLEDNCPLHVNPAQFDQDGDGIGDACSGDGDGDGYPAVTDCQDDNPNVHPNQPEVCDGIDNDCSGGIDDNADDATRWFRDIDGDGFPGEVDVVWACERPGENYVGEEAIERIDCDDVDRDIYPDAPEHCDGVDEDCDGVADDNPVDGLPYFADVDGDGYGDSVALGEGCVAEHPAGSVLNNQDCRDDDEDIHPGASEVCDGVDNDCDELLDDDDNSLDIRTATRRYFDGDGDGYGRSPAGVTCGEVFDDTVTDNSDCDDDDPLSNPLGVEVCDGADNDCNGDVDDVAVLPVWYVDADGDGYGDPDNFVENCVQPAGTVVNSRDCRDDDPLINPDAEEDVGNDIDENCDGVAPLRTILDSLSEDRTLNELESPYLISNRLTVPEGITLTVPECIPIYVGLGGGLGVDGTLIMEGTEECPIEIRSSADVPEAGQWHGIEFMRGPTATFDSLGAHAGGSLLRHVHIYHSAGAVRVNESAPYLNNVWVLESAGIGVEVALPDDFEGEIRINECEFEGLETAISGIAPRADLTIQGSVFRHNGIVADITASTTMVRQSVGYDNSGGFSLTADTMLFSENQVWAAAGTGLRIDVASGAANVSSNLFAGGDVGATVARLPVSGSISNNVFAGNGVGLVVGSGVNQARVRTNQFHGNQTAVQIGGDPSLGTVAASGNSVQSVLGPFAIEFAGGATPGLFSNSWTEGGFLDLPAGGRVVHAGHEAGEVISMVRNYWNGIVGDEVENLIVDAATDDTLGDVEPNPSDSNWPASAPPPAPLRVNGTVLPGAIRVTWSAVNDRRVLGYRVYVVSEDGYDRDGTTLVAGSGALTSELIYVFDVPDSSVNHWVYVQSVLDNESPSLAQMFVGDHSWYSTRVLAITR